MRHKAVLDGLHCAFHPPKYVIEPHRHNLATSSGLHKTSGGKNSVDSDSTSIHVLAASSRSIR